MLGRLIADIPGLELTPEDKEFILHPQLGGLIFFARNIESIEQLKSLIVQIRHLRPELILAIDQEGGRVQRIKEPLTVLPPLAEGIKQPSREAAASWLTTHAWLMASEILSLDIDISFSPVLDLNLGHSEIIGNRAISGDPAELIELAQAYLLGMEQAGMAATGKHFPGHGYVTPDSHLELPVDDRELRDIEQRDLNVFLHLLPTLPALMTAHIVYENIAPEPVAFSNFWVEHYLKKTHAYSGIVFSDDLNMVGATAYIPDPKDKALTALNAGCDVLLNCNNRETSNLMLEAMESSQITKLPEQQANTLRCARGWHWEAFSTSSERIEAQKKLLTLKPVP